MFVVFRKKNTVYTILFYKTGMNVLLVAYIYPSELPKVQRVCVSIPEMQFVMEQLELR